MATTRTVRRSGTASSARDRMQEEQARIQQRKDQRALRSKEPRRFFLKTNEEREIVIVDAVEVDDLFLRREHQLMGDSGKYDFIVPCNDDTGNCPVCEHHPQRPSSLNLLLTIIDLTPYTNSNGDEIPWSKRLLGVKPGQHKKFLRWAEREERGEIGLRGLILRTFRTGDKAFSIGDDIEVVGRMSEDDLLTYEAEYVDAENKVHPIIGHEAFDYDDIFPQLSDEELAELIGVQPRERLGSRRATERANGDDGGSRRAAPSSRAAPGRAAPAGRAAPSRAAPGRAAPSRRAPESEDNQDDNDAPQETTGRRAAPSRAAAPTPRRGAAPTRAARRPADDPDDGGDGDPQDDAPSQPATRRGAATTRTATRRGAAPAADGRNDIGGEAPWDGDSDGTNQVPGADGSDAAPAARRGAVRRAVRRN